MKKIIVKKKDGTVREFNHVGRTGGSYTIGLRYEDNFAIISDEWGDETIFPSSEIESIETESPRRW